MCKIIQTSQLRPGDIILFVSRKSKKPKGISPKGLINKAQWLVARVAVAFIKCATKSKYTHAAICYDSKHLAEASWFGYPVSFGYVEGAVAACKYAAVFRSTWAFRGTERVGKLQAFLRRIVDEGVAYNGAGLWKYWRYKARHDELLHERVEAFFNGTAPLETFDKGPYFCSELVASAFYAIGAVNPIAAAVYDPRFAAPADLVKDNTYGAFLGYLVPNATTQIPKNDEFQHKDPYPFPIS